MKIEISGVCVFHHLSDISSIPSLEPEAPNSSEFSGEIFPQFHGTCAAVAKRSVRQTVAADVLSGIREEKALSEEIEQKLIAAI